MADFFETMTGDMTPTGAAVFNVAIGVAGSVASSGSPSENATRTFDGTLTPEGALTKSTQAVLELLGSLTPSGTVRYAASVFQAGGLTPAGALAIAQSLTLAGSLTPAGALVSSPTHVLAGGLTPTGSLLEATTRIFSGSLTPFGALQAGIGESPCNITVGEFKIRLGALLDDPDHIYYTSAEIVHALNVGQRLWGLLTLCFERTATFALTNTQTWYRISDQISDYLRPLRVTHSGTRLRPDTVHNLDLRARAWRATAGNPTRYVQSGLDLFAITPQPASGSHTLALTYAAEPAALALDSDVPEMQGDQSAILQDFCVWWLRFKEGGQEHANTVTYLKRFLDDAQKYASFVRAKNRAQHYDAYPFDLASFDRSRLEVKLARANTWRQMKKGESDDK